MYVSSIVISLFNNLSAITVANLLLIRIMLKAKEKVSNEKLLEDMSFFSPQEGNHFRNHARTNEIVSGKLNADTANRLLVIEHDLKTDYEHFFKDKSLDYSLAYAKGFEARTCAGTLGSAQRPPKGFVSDGWRELLDWHGLEEIENRTVVFDVYQHVAGSYYQSVYQGVKAQIHYLGYIYIFYRVMLRAKVFRGYPYMPLFIVAGGLRYINKFFPWYNPANYKIPDKLDEHLSEYSLATGAE